MKKNIFAVCDLEGDYASNFMNYITQKKSVPFEIHAFTTVEKLIAFGQKMPIELLLISGNAMNAKVKELNIGKIIILSEGVHAPELDQYPSVYKYQSSANVVREVMACYGEERTSALAELPILKKTTEILAVYSPLGRCLKTSFALALGQILAKEKGVLFLDLEGRSGFEELLKINGSLQNTPNLTDLLYYVRHGTPNLIFKISSMIRNIQHLDYIPPVINPVDVHEVSSEDWERLLDEIEYRSSYEYMVIDVGNDVDDPIPILNRCSKIYMPVLSDVISAAKITQFENYLKVWDFSQILTKIVKVKPPFHSAANAEDYFNQLVWSELGDYIRDLLRKELE
ncbi:MAG: hypothetical protein Q4B47_01890 [Eubacteriales bacterium]|nr:hypothetical protein [Eubacteriales bacterium]